MAGMQADQWSRCAGGGGLVGGVVGERFNYSGGVAANRGMPASLRVQIMAVARAITVVWRLFRSAAAAEAGGGQCGCWRGGNLEGV